MNKTEHFDPDVVAWLPTINPDGSRNACDIAYAKSGYVGLRDHTNACEPILVFTPDEWSAFVAGVDDGEFSLDALTARQ